MFSKVLSFRRELIFLFSVISVLPSCDSAEIKAIPRDRLLFRPTNSFDNALAATLKASTPKVSVSFPNRVTLDNMPDNLDKWLAAVESGGGQVQRADQSAGFTGVLLALLPLILPRLQARIEEINQSRLFSSARGYDAVIFFDNDGQAMKELIFQKR